MANPSKLTTSPRPPQFCKPFHPQFQSEHLRIPPAFVKHIEGVHRFPSTVSLKGPGGGIWYTDLVNNSGELFFDKGWKEFVHDHSLQLGDFLVFKYKGNLQFDVLVFDGSTCQKEAAWLARPSRGGNCVKEVAAVDGVLQKTGRGRLRKRMSDDCIVEGMVPPKRGRGRGRPRPRKNTGDDCIILNGQPLPKENMVPCKEELDHVSAKRQLGVRSQRRPVTPEEVEKALLKAKAFKSDHPFCIIQMRDSYVYVGFALGIPLGFARQHLPQPCGNVILWDPSGTPWEVKFMCYSRHASLNAGWIKFSITNNLESGDVCVLELVKKYEMRVHIYRVVEEIAPLIRAFLCGS